MINNSQKGISIYITVMILAVLLSASLSLSSIIVGGAKISQSLGGSVEAYHAAETGLEQALRNIRKNSNCNNFNGSFPITGSSYTVTITYAGGACPGTGNVVIESLGEYGGITRKIETSLGDLHLLTCTDDCSEESGGVCVAKAAGDYDLPSCQACDGISLTHVNIANGVTDTLGVHTCDSAHYACNGAGSCSAPLNSTCILSTTLPPAGSCSSKCPSNGYVACLGSYNNATCESWGSTGCDSDSGYCQCSQYLY